MPKNLSPALFAYCLVFSSAFGIYSIHLGTIGMTPINGLSVLLFPVFVLMVLLENDRPSLTAVGVLHLLFFIAAFVGCIFARNTMAALRGAGSYVIDYFLCFLYMIYFIRTRAQLETALRVFIVAGVLSAIMGLIELGAFFFFRKIVLPPFASLFRPRLSLGYYGYMTGYLSIPGFMKMFGFFAPNTPALGSYLLIPLVFSAYYVRQRIMYVWAVLLLGGVIFLTADRNAYVGLATLMLAYYFFRRATSIQPYQFVFRSYAILLVCCLSLGLVYITRDPRVFADATVHVTESENVHTLLHLLERVHPTQTTSYQESADFFTSHMGLAAEYGFQNFGFGLGAQNFDDYVYERYPVKYGSHSNFVIFLGDHGIIGLLLQVALVFATVGLGLWTYYRYSAQRGDTLPLYLGALYAGLAMVGVVRTFYLTPHTFLVAGMIVKLYMLSKSPRSNVLC